MTCFDLFFLEKGQEAREHAHAVFDRVDAEVFLFGVEAATGRGNTVNDGSAGLGDAIDSWVGSGANQAVSGDQISAALGADFISQLAQKAGVADSEAAGSLAQLLPQLINYLTPNGQAPAAGLGNTDELMGQLGGLLGGGQAGGLGQMLGGLAGAFLKK